jgi:glycerol-3-phosphate dehydrogenase
MYSATLSPAARERSLATLGGGQELDVLVIGGASPAPAALSTP